MVDLEVIIKESTFQILQQSDKVTQRLRHQTLKVNGITFRTCSQPELRGWDVYLRGSYEDGDTRVDNLEYACFNEEDLREAFKIMCRQQCWTLKINDKLYGGRRQL